MGPNVQFLDYIVRGYFSLHHTMSVELAVCTILMESLNALKALVKANPNNGDVNTEVPVLPGIDALFHSADFAETLKEIPVDISFLKNQETNGSFPDMVTWFMTQGIVALLEKIDKPYIHATARGFGMRNASTMKISREKLILFIARVALDLQFHTEPPKEIAPRPAAAIPQQGHPLVEVSTNAQKSLVHTPSRTTADKELSRSTSIGDGKVSGVRARSARKKVRIELFSDVPLTRSNKKRSRRASSSTKTNVHESPFKKNNPIGRHQLLTPKKGAKVRIPSEIDLSMLEHACTGHRQVPLTWLQRMEPQVAWKMLYGTNSLPVEELKQHRLPIGPETSTWQLQQWYFGPEVLSYCSENKLLKGVQGRKKSLLIAQIMKHIRGPSEVSSFEGNAVPQVQDSHMHSKVDGNEESAEVAPEVLERDIFEGRDGSHAQDADMHPVTRGSKEPDEITPEMPQRWDLSY